MLITVLVCGGRYYRDRRNVFLTLNDLFLNLQDDDEMFIVAGGAKGADTFAVEWAQSLEISYKIYMADWNQYGKRAGFIRNSEMLNEGKPDLIIAFPGGAGTEMMVDIATRAGKEVWRR